jgi:hypothetical protein
MEEFYTACNCSKCFKKNRFKTWVKVKAWKYSTRLTQKGKHKLNYNHGKNGWSS